MGNDMFNDEQLKHAEIVQKETEDALGWWKERALKAEAERDALLSKAAPPADAAKEAVKESAAILRRRLDTGRECRDCGEVLGLKGMVDDFLDLLSALSTPAPAPSAKEGR